MEGRFFGKDVLKRPSCPFCGVPIDRPGDPHLQMAHEMPLGRCRCGAAYAYDVTGHNLGTAMTDALVLACEGDWNRAWELLPDSDYAEARLEHYDDVTHQVVTGGAYEGRRISGTLYFIRLQGADPERTEGRRPETATRSRGVRKKRMKKRFSKRDIEALVADYDMDRVLEIARQDKRIIRDLQRLLYSADKRTRLSAADAIGKAAAVISREDPPAVSRLLQGLFTSLMDTAASSWGNLDAIGEIIRNRPRRFAGHIPQLYQFTRDRALLGDVLHALARISERKPEMMLETAVQFIPLLRDPEPRNRAYAAVVLGNLEAPEAREELTRVLNDGAPVDIYHRGTLLTRTVGEVAAAALERLRSPTGSDSP